MSVIADTMLPDFLIRFGSILGMSLFDIKNAKTLNVPDAKLREAYPDNYFVQNPSLQIMWYDSESGSIKKYLLTVGVQPLPQSKIGPMQLALESPSRPLS